MLRRPSKCSFFYDLLALQSLVGWFDRPQMAQRGLKAVAVGLVGPDMSASHFLSITSSMKSFSSCLVKALNSSSSFSRRTFSFILFKASIFLSSFANFSFMVSVLSFGSWSEPLEEEPLEEEDDIFLFFFAFFLGMGSEGGGLIGDIGFSLSMSSRTVEKCVAEQKVMICD